MAKIKKRTIGNGETRYVVDYYDLQGKRRKERFKRERDAKARLGEVLSQRETGELRPRAADIKFRQLVDDWKLEHWPNLRPNSRKAYGRVIDAHLLPALGERKLRTITRKDAEDLRQRVETAAGGDRRAKGGRVSANLALTVLRLILGYAETHDYVSRNIASGLRARRTDEQRQEREVLSPDELRKLFNAADGMWRVFFMTAAYTGLRRGELLGLQWRDIDWASGTLHVRRQMQNCEISEKLKSKAARRKVEMPDELIGALKRWKLACPKGHFDLVFPNAKGSALPEPTVYQQFRAALRRAGLREVTLHALRHGYASMLVSRGLLKLAQVTMGHSNISMTVGTYGHLLPDDYAAGPRVIAALMAGRGGNFLGTSGAETAGERAIGGT